MQIKIPTKEEIEERKKFDINENSMSGVDYSTNSSKKININNAKQEELERLPGIGTSTAIKIINYRKENGKFKSIEEIMEVKGIGESKYNSIKDLITI